MKNKVYKFPRLCSVTGEGMWEGYCFRDGEEYFKHESDLLKHIHLLEIHIPSNLYTESQILNYCYDDGLYYFTEWEDLDLDGWYESLNEDGTDAVWVNADGVLPSVTIEFGSVLYEFNPSERDEWQSDGVYDYHYDLDNNEVCVYRVVDGDTDTSNTIHKQIINN